MENAMRLPTGVKPFARKLAWIANQLYGVQDAHLT